MKIRQSSVHGEDTRVRRQSFRKIGIYVSGVRVVVCVEKECKKFKALCLRNFANNRDLDRQAVGQNAGTSLEREDSIKRPSILLGKFDRTKVA